MLYREIIAVCSQTHTTPLNTLCGQNVGFVYVKPCGTNSDQGFISVPFWESSFQGLAEAVPVRSVQCNTWRLLMHLCTVYTSYVFVIRGTHNTFWQTLWPRVSASVLTWSFYYRSFRSRPAFFISQFFSKLKCVVLLLFLLFYLTRAGYVHETH
jgi:hypothetical protein